MSCKAPFVKALLAYKKLHMNCKIVKETQLYGSV
jgi:hypothetical protein